MNKRGAAPLILVLGGPLIIGILVLTGILTLSGAYVLVSNARLIGYIIAGLIGLIIIRKLK